MPNHLTPDELSKELGMDRQEVIKLCIEEGWRHGPSVDIGRRWDPADVGPAIRDLLPMMLDGMEGIDFVVHRQVADGNLVMNERTDVMRRTNGGRVELPVMGTFEVRDGRIAAWRDYFDFFDFLTASVQTRNEETGATAINQFFQ